jgi:hypothetical protein
MSATKLGICYISRVEWEPTLSCSGRGWRGRAGGRRRRCWGQVSLLFAGRASSTRAGWNRESSQGRRSTAVPDEEEDDEQEAREVEEGCLDRGRDRVSLDAIRLFVGLGGMRAYHLVYATWGCRCVSWLCWELLGVGYRVAAMMLLRWRELSSTISWCVPSKSGASLKVDLLLHGGPTTVTTPVNCGEKPSCSRQPHLQPSPTCNPSPTRLELDLFSVLPNQPDEFFSHNADPSQIIDYRPRPSI